MSSKLAQSMVWLTVSKFSLQIIKWASTFIVIRYLTPNDYAIVSLFSLVVTFAVTLCGEHLSSSLIQRERIEEGTVGHHMTLSILIGLVSGGLLWLCAPWIARLFDSPVLLKILPIGSVSILISAIIAVPSNLIKRDLQFNKTAVISLTLGVIEVIGTLLLAINGFGYLSIILGHFISRVIALPIYIVVCHYSLVPKLKGILSIRKDVIFNAYLMASGLCWLAYARIDIFLGGLSLTKAELGIYAVALQLVLMPMNKLMPILRQVSYPVLSRRSSSNAGDLYFRMLELTLLVITPVSAGLALTADLWVPLIIGERWNPIVPVSAVLAVLVPFRIILETQHPFLQSKGLGHEVLLNMVIAVVVLFISVGFMQRYGLMGIAWGITGAFPLVALLTVWRTIHVTQLAVDRMLSAVLRPSACLVIMCLAVSLFRQSPLTGYDELGIIELVSAIVIGVLAYTIAALLLCKPSIGWIYSRVRG